MSSQQQCVDERILGNNIEADRYFDMAIQASKRLKLETLEETLKRRKLEFHGRNEEARNPYFWNDTQHS